MTKATKLPLSSDRTGYETMTRAQLISIILAYKYAAEIYGTRTVNLFNAAIDCFNDGFALLDIGDSQDVGMAIVLNKLLVEALKWQPPTGEEY
jgi:hypothetical protein